MIVISAFKVMASFGKDDAGEEMKRGVLGAIVGVFIVAFDSLIVSALGWSDSGAGTGGGTPTALIALVMDAVRNLLMYLALIAVAIIIYAGIMMVVRFGSDDQYEKTKSLIVRVLIGLVIILFGYFFVSFIINAVLGNPIA